MIAATPLALAIRAAADPPLSQCTDRSSACLAAVARSYVDALRSDDPAVGDKVRAAPNVQRWENGVHNVVARPGLVAALRRTQPLVAGVRDVRYFTERSGSEVFAVL